MICFNVYLTVISSSNTSLNLVIPYSTSFLDPLKILRLRKVMTPGFSGLNVYHLPVDSARTLIRLDIHLVVVDVNLRNIHLKVIGQKLDWFPHSANARPARCLEHLLQGGQVGSRSYKTKRLMRVESGISLPFWSKKAQSLPEEEQEGTGKASF